MKTLATNSMHRVTAAVFALLAIAGIALGWNKGQLPRRDIAAVPADAPAATAPDLQLYREVIAEVRAGRGYYEVAAEKIPQFGFPVSSPLNWRLPTYAWTLSLLPNKFCIQAALLGLGITGLCLAFVATCQRSSVGYAALTVFLHFGVLRWAFDGDAYLAQEPWAAALIVISLAAHALAPDSCPLSPVPCPRLPWRLMAVLAGIAALMFRELALPYCAIALAVAGFNRRWLEAAAWTAGIAIFFGLFAWHVGQVRLQLVGIESPAAGAGLAQWLRFGGLDFVLLTTRMNSLLFAAPAFLLWLYLLASLFGLARRNDETSVLACLAALAYLLSFAFVGRPENFYWGLLPAPLLAWGAVDGLRAAGEWWKRTGFNRPSSRSPDIRPDRPGPALGAAFECRLA